MIDAWRNKIIQGDCRELLEQLPDESVDLVLTDPPYNLGKNYGKSFNDKKTEDEYWYWFVSIFQQIFRVLRDGFLYISHSDKGIYRAKPELEKIGFEYVQTLIWWGKNGYSMQLHRNTWSFRHEPILFMKKGSPEHLLAGEKGMWYTSVLEVPRPQSNFKEGRYHPTQKPIKLYRNILQRTPGNLILDPFVGSGTTAIACMQIERDYIGFELSPEYCKLANKRLEPYRQQMKLGLATT